MAVRMRIRARGVTLAEMLVAVTITIGMLMVGGMIFKSASDAAGKATANNEIMQQLRMLTDQLERDFRGLRPGMPMAIIFEPVSYTLNNGGDIPVGRQDRIVFFADGDFQSLDGISGNLARIFYGQMAESLPVSAESGAAADRRILARRQRILTAAGSITPSGATWATSGKLPEYYDYLSYETATVAFWRNELWQYFGLCYFDSTITDPCAVASMVRRPSLDRIETAVASGTINNDALQRLYMLSDVADFTVQFWHPIEQRWFPNDMDLLRIANASLTYPLGMTTAGRGFAIYWNTPDMPKNAAGDPGVTPLGTGTDVFYWWSPTDLGASALWPSAIKFTFTLYDKNRRHFPDGRTFSYIVKLPERK
jgi:hypothetical protein